MWQIHLMISPREQQLERENAELRAEVKRQALLIEEQARVIHEQARAIKELQNLVTELRERIAVLEKNSSTSSKPPSSDITKPKHQQRQPGKRKRGGQKGRKGVTRRSLPAHQIDKISAHDHCICPDCAGSLNQEIEEIRKHQVIDLVEKPTLAIEHQLLGRYCSHCEVTQYPPLPEDVVPGQLLGLRLQAAICSLKAETGMSYTELQRVCKELFKVEVSIGMLCAVIARGSEALETPYTEVWEAAQESEVLHADETGWKDSGVLHWVWLFCNAALSLFVIRDTRSGKVLHEVLGEEFAGSLISDFFGAYPAFLEERLQLCLAHLIRDIKFLKTLPDEASKHFGKRVESSFRSIFRVWHERDELSSEEYMKKMERRCTRLHNLVCRAKFDKGKARTVQRRIVKRWDCLFRFVKEPHLYEPTNNRAERDLRALVRIRRQTQGSRSDGGQRWMERSATIVGTCRKQGKSAYDFILQAFRAQNSFRYQVPSLFAGI